LKAKGSVVDTVVVGSAVLGAPRLGEGLVVQALASLDVCWDQEMAGKSEAAKTTAS
jgi:hypothetical protein